MVKPASDSSDQQAKQHEGGLELNLDVMPNIAQLFDLFPYVMYYNRTVPINGKKMHEFKYSYPMGKVANAANGPEDSELLAYFHTDSMIFDRLIVRANSLNITSPFTLYATKPVTAAKF